jgi:hypothetical protein
MAASESKPEKQDLQPRSAYDWRSSEVKQRRQKLFEEIAKNRTPETDAAMEKFAAAFFAKFNS